MESVQVLIFGTILILNTISSKAGEPKSDELTLRNQLFADVFLLREGVDRLEISVEVINKRFNNQMEILKGVQSKMSTGDPDSEEENAVCDRVTGMFNTTLRKHNILESRLITKLEEMHDDQTTRLDEIVMKQKLNKNCGSQDASSTILTIFSTTLSEVVGKIEKFDDKLNLQQTQFNKFVLNQLKVLQEINEKLSKNQEQFETISKELINLKELKTYVNKLITYSRPKLPMEVIFGITSSNITRPDK